MSTNPTVNPWQKFKSLLPDGQRTYGTVAVKDAVKNQCQVTLQSGDTIIVIGQATVGERVMVKDGQIQQTVQALPFGNIELY